MEKELEKKGFLANLHHIFMVVAGILLIILFRIFIAQPYIVSGLSMDPTFKDGDYLIVDQLSKRFNEPKRGDILIIKYPKNPSRFFIKRLIAFPEEEVRIDDGVVYIKERNSDEWKKIEENYIVFEKKEEFYMEMKKDEYFVMGDNRSGSFDSRYWGPVPKKYIIGKPIFRLFPFNKINFNLNG